MSEHKSDLPILLVGTLNSIRTMTRFQKFAFLADKEIFTAVDKYSDWKPHYFGPFSRDLQSDVDAYCKDELLKETDVVHPVSDDYVSSYSLTLTGRKEFNSLYNNNVSTIKKISAFLSPYQFHNTNASLLYYVYANYKDYTTNSIIKDEIGG